MRHPCVLGPCLSRHKALVATIIIATVARLFDPAHGYGHSPPEISPAATTTSSSPSSSSSTTTTTSTFVFPPGANHTETLSPSGYEATIARGNVPWRLWGVDKSPVNVAFDVMAGVVPSTEADDIVAVLDSVDSFDEDLDFDGESTFELHLTDKDRRELADLSQLLIDRQTPARRRLEEIVQPILRDRILPFINLRFTEDCGDHGCHVCTSFFRRYRQDLRSKLPLHFDTDALATAVVSLSSAGVDHDGGIFVASNAGSAKFVPLQKGDALVHNSDLFHGVNVPEGSRYTWVIWVRDTEDCGIDISHWHRDRANKGDPLAQYQVAQRIHHAAQFRNNNITTGGKASSIEREKKERARFKWMEQSADSGFAPAMIEVGNAYEHGTGVAMDLKRALKYWSKAEDMGEPDASNNIGNYFLHSKHDEVAAVKHFRLGAERGSTGSQHNLGIAYYLGTGGLTKNHVEAVRWLLASGTKRSHSIIAQLCADQESQVTSKVGWLSNLTRAAVLGDAESQLSLAYHLYETVPGDEGVVEAAAWLLKASRLNHAESMYTLARLWHDTRGNNAGLPGSILNQLTAKSVKRILKKAIDGGSKDARRLLEKLQRDERRGGGGGGGGGKTSTHGEL